MFLHTPAGRVTPLKLGFANNPSSMQCPLRLNRRDTILSSHSSSGVGMFGLH